MDKQYELATFAGGCFWCMVEPFDELPGIIEVVSGYTGGLTLNPTYEAVCSNRTGHVEAIQITFDPDIFPYEKLLDIYWRQIDPTNSIGQFNDIGESYQTAIFYHTEVQRRLAEDSKEALNKSNRFDSDIVTQILPAKLFYRAEEKHQDYYKKNSFHYKLYKKGSGREDFINRYWKTTYDQRELKQRLTPLQFEVTQNSATESPFDNEYYHHKEEGIYVDIVSGEPLFSSLDKYDAHCGWPSFTKPVNNHQLKYSVDKHHGMTRTEVRSKEGNSHLGHVLNVEFLIKHLNRVLFGSQCF